MSALRPRRSVLYMPAANERALEKAKGIPADAIIFDLEDAVSPDAKDVARAQAIAAVNSGEYGKRELTIRCNALTMGSCRCCSGCQSVRVSSCHSKDQLGC
ncbi:MAG: hypothetical protein RL691_1399 [Actinomycetota bacterium]